MQESERANTPKIALPGRLRLETIGCTLQEVEDNWATIESALSKAGVGKKDVPFNAWVRENMMSAYSYLDQLLEKGVEPFSVESLGYMLGLSSRVHYGQNQALIEEYGGAIEANTQKFY